MIMAVQTMKWKGVIRYKLGKKIKKARQCAWLDI
jgi:hypothetical protein